MSVVAAFTEAWSVIESTLGEPCLVLPKGDQAGQFSVTGVIGRSDEEGANEVRGDGRNFDGRNGQETRRSARFSCDKSQNVEEDMRDPWSVIVFDSVADRTAFVGGDLTIPYELYRIKRRIGSTRESETFLIVRVPAGGIQRRPERKG